NTLIIVLLLGLVGGFGGWYLHNADSRATSFRTVQVERGDLLAMINATGTIEPEEVVDIGAQVAGQIISFGADPRGNGKLIDYDTSEANYRTTKATLAVGEATVVQNKAAQKDAEANVLKAKATLKDSEAALKNAQINLGYCTIKSPVKGVIVDRRVNTGQTVVASLNAPSLFLIAKDLKRMQVWASVNEADIGQIHPGQPVRFTVDAFSGRVFQGQVGQ